MTGAEGLEAAIRRAGSARPALAAFLTAGFPARAGFADLVRRVAAAADVIELGVPFSDPMADGVTIQEASRIALSDGVNLPWILDVVRELEMDTPIVLMSYLNPLLSYGLPRLAADGRRAGIAGFIVPDLPYEESDPLRKALEGEGLALVQLVTPLTPAGRRRRLAEASGGFLYAVTRTGTTGGRDTPEAEALADIRDYLLGLREVSPVPVLAGFGIRTPAQVREIGDVADGVIVGSALIECLTNGGDPAAFVRSLREEEIPV